MTTRKRSASLKLTTMLAGAASLTLAGCDDHNGGQASWDPNQGEKVQAFSYKTLQECKDAGEVPVQQCEASYAAAQKEDQEKAPRYEARSTCEDVYGPGNCVPRSYGGHDVFTPLLAGFVIGRMMDGYHLGRTAGPRLQHRPHGHHAREHRPARRHSQRAAQGPDPHLSRLARRVRRRPQLFQRGLQGRLRRLEQTDKLRLTLN